VLTFDGYDDSLLLPHTHNVHSITLWVYVHSTQLNPLQQHYLLDARASGHGTADTYPELYLGDKEYGVMIGRVIANTIDTQLQWSAVPKDQVYTHRPLHCGPNCISHCGSEHVTVALA